MKATLKSNLIKFFTFLIVICICVGTSTISGDKNGVFADESPASFSMDSNFRTGIDGKFSGLNFTTSVNTAWLAENSAESFGTIVFPAENVDNFDMEGSDVDTIKNAVEGIKFVYTGNVTEAFTYNASIVFDVDVIKTFEGVSDDNIDSVLKGFYAKEFAAVSYAIVDGVIVWSDDSIISSMVKVATEALSDPALFDVAKAFIPSDA